MTVFHKDAWEYALTQQHPELMEFKLIEREDRGEGDYNILEDESVVLHSTVEPMLIEIKHPTLIKVFKNNFDILWSVGKEL